MRSQGLKRLVIPGLRTAQNPESSLSRHRCEQLDPSCHPCEVLDSGSPLRGVRNDEVWCVDTNHARHPLAVIPGLRAAQNPESSLSRHRSEALDSGSPLRGVRNDGR